MRSERWLEMMVSGDTDQAPIPLEGPDGSVLDPDKYWVRFRSPNGIEHDELSAVQTRNKIETDVEFDPDDIENTRSVTAEYTDTRRIPLLLKAIDLGLIVDAALPKKDKNGVGVYKWSHTRSDNVEFIRKQNILLLSSLVYMVIRFLLVPEDLMDEGEDSVGALEPSTSVPTETGAPENV